MKLLRSKIFLMLFLFVAFLPSAVEGGIFTDMLLSPNNGEYISSVPSSTAIFQKNLGVANPVQWARKLPGPGSSEQFLSSISWKNTRNDFLKNYGRSSQVRQYLDYQEYLFRKSIKINNKAHFRSLDVKGNLAESLMDDFYLKDGWEIIDGKRGRNGFDGLYVKRSKNGTVIDWIATDAKSGSSKLNMTSRGMQLSPEWVDGNLKDLLAMAQEEYKKMPSEAAKQRIADLKQIMRVQGRRPRVFTMKIGQYDGKIQYRIENIGIDGRPVGKPMFVDMQAARTGTMQQLVYKNLEHHISIYDPKGAAALVKKIERGFKRGTIKNDSDLYRFIKREIPDKKLARAVAQELGEEPPRGSLAGALGEKISKNSGIIISATVVAGFIIAHDAMRDGITSDTFIKAGIASSATVVTAIALDYGMNVAVRFASEQIARYVLSQSGKRVTERAVSNLASKLAPTVSRALGGTLQVAFALYFIGDTIYNYNMGNMTQTDMIVNVSIVALTTAGTVFFTCTKGGATVGAFIGSFFGPAGTAAGGTIGTAIGVTIGVIGGVATGGYTWYVENKKQERLLAETRERANWETKNNKERLDSMICELEQKSEQDRISAWKGLLPVY